MAAREQGWRASRAARKKESATTTPQSERALHLLQHSPAVIALEAQRIGAI
jgi:hypothetical protein